MGAFVSYTWALEDGHIREELKLSPKERCPLMFTNERLVQFLPGQGCFFLNLVMTSNQLKHNLKSLITFLAIEMFHINRCISVVDKEMHQNDR